MIILLAIIGALSFFAPKPAPVEPPPEPPPIVETVETRVSGAVSGSKLESIAGLGIVGSCGYVGFRLARAGERRKRKGIVETDNAQYALLMRRLSDMAAIMEAVKDE